MVTKEEIEQIEKKAELNELKEDIQHIAERTLDPIEEETAIKKILENTTMTRTIIKKQIAHQRKKIIKEKKTDDVIDEDKKNIALPVVGKLISEFATEIVEEIKDKQILFFRGDTRDVVEIGKIKINDEEDYRYTGFIVIKPNRFITMCEQYFVPGIYLEDRETKEAEFKCKSMSAMLSQTLLASDIVHNAIPHINRMFTVPIPIIHKDKLTFPKKGYDLRFFSWRPYNAPEITEPKMRLEDAKKIIFELFKEFCFEEHQDYINAIAGLITPFIRGLLPSFNTRTPVFFYIANRERAGKDYLAGITGILYEGQAIEEAPISTSENAKTNNTDELRKKLLSAMISGRKRLHFSNNKGYINNAVFEAVITAKEYSDRILGRSEMMTFENELDFSLSGNTGIGFTADLANRSRFVHLFLEIEDANARKFENPNLHGYVLENRGLILSAIYSLVRNWNKKDKPKGTVPFASFSDWADVCGGIMEAAGYKSPCIINETKLSIGGDKETEEMKELFELCYEKHPDKTIKNQDIKEILRDVDCTLFAYFDFDKKVDQTRFGVKLTKYVGRILGGVLLSEDDKTKKGKSREFVFSKKEKHTQKNIFECVADKDCPPRPRCPRNTPQIIKGIKNYIYRGMGTECVVNSMEQGNRGKGGEVGKIEKPIIIDKIEEKPISTGDAVTNGSNVSKGIPSSLVALKFPIGVKTPTNLTNLTKSQTLGKIKELQYIDGNGAPHSDLLLAGASEETIEALARDGEIYNPVSGRWKLI